MDCKEVKEKLPEYLAGVLDNSISQEIRLHLKTCDLCRKEADELGRSFPECEFSEQTDMKKLLKRTKRKFNMGIVKVVAITLLVLWAVYMLPAVLWGAWSFKQPDVSRALMDTVQFSQPEKVNSWGNSGINRFSISVPLSITTLPVVGKNAGQQHEFIAEMSVITGKITAPHILGANFVHPNNFKGADLGDTSDIKMQQKRLEKNADTTVATVDYSLNSLMSLTDAASLIRSFDVEICWMAVESGIENTVPKNMSFNNQQVLQWGIPGKLSKPGVFDFAVFDADHADQFGKAVLEEMKWLDNNKKLIKPDTGLLRYNAIDNSIGGKALYLISNGIKIYGLRVTGPSSELLKLTGQLAPRTMNVIGMDFWNW
jgi:hypothetical protein